MNRLTFALSVGVDREALVLQLAVFSVAGVDDKTMRDVNAASCRREHGELLVCYDSIQPNMALLHDMCARCGAAGQIPVSGL